MDHVGKSDEQLLREGVEALRAKDEATAAAALSALTMRHAEQAKALTANDPA